MILKNMILGIMIVLDGTWKTQNTTVPFTRYFSRCTIFQYMRPHATHEQLYMAIAIPYVATYDIYDIYDMI